MKNNVTEILNSFPNNTLSKLGEEIRFMNESNGSSMPQSEEMKSLFNNPAGCMKRNLTTNFDINH